MLKRYEGKEEVFVDSVRLCGNDTGTAQRNRACIALRIQRNPSVGDKFASRAGQKGKVFLQSRATIKAGFSLLLLSCLSS